MFQESLTRQRKWIITKWSNYQRIQEKQQQQKCRGDHPCPKDPDTLLETRCSLIALENKAKTSRASARPLGKPVLQTSSPASDGQGAGEDHLLKEWQAHFDFLIFFKCLPMSLNESAATNPRYNWLCGQCIQRKVKSVPSAKYKCFWHT